MPFVKLIDASRQGNGYPLRVNVDRIIWYQPQEHDDHPQTETSPDVRSRLHYDMGGAGAAMLLQQTVRQLDVIFARLPDTPPIITLTDASSTAEGIKLRINPQRIVWSLPYTHTVAPGSHVETAPSVNSRLQLDAGLGTPAVMHVAETLDEIDAMIGMAS